MTREECGAEVLAEAGALFGHMDGFPDWQSMTQKAKIVAHGCAALLRGEVKDTHEMTALAVAILLLVRDIKFELSRSKP